MDKTPLASFSSSLVKGLLLEESIWMACAVGGLNVESYALVEDRWAKRRLDVRRDYWQFNAEQKVWIGKNDAQRGG
jgi:hypothetical protein